MQYVVSLSGSRVVAIEADGLTSGPATVDFYVVEPSQYGERHVTVASFPHHMFQYAYVGNALVSDNSPTALAPRQQYAYANEGTLTTRAYSPALAQALQGQAI